MRRPAFAPGIVLAVGLLLVAGCSWFRPAPRRSCPRTSCTSSARRISTSGSTRTRGRTSRRSSSATRTRPFAPRARFLWGEAYYREAEFGKAIKEFEVFMSFYPRHQIADLVQYRLAMAYYDQMKPVEQDQAITTKALDQFKKLVKEYPESRYASDALAKIDICRGRLAQKELWVANWYFTQGNPGGARQRLELILKEYPRTLVIPGNALAARRGQRARGQDARGHRGSSSASPPSSRTPTTGGGPPSACARRNRPRRHRARRRRPPLRHPDHPHPRNARGHGPRRGRATTCGARTPPCSAWRPGPPSGWARRPGST